MKKPVILVRYAEIGVKLGRTRTYFEKRLLQGIRCSLAFSSDKINSIRLSPGRVIIDARLEPPTSKPLAQMVARVFGVHEAIPAWSIPNDLNSLREAVRAIAREHLRSVPSFAVRARRVETYPVTSKELEKILGAEVVDELPGIKVDLRQPKEVIRVEVRSRRAYIYLDSWRVRGVGGLPYGVEGNALVPILDPEADLLAAWLVARRGAYLNLYHRPGERSIVEKFVEKWVPCRDARIHETSNPLNAAAERAARGAGLLVNSRIISVKTRWGSVWSVSPLQGLPEGLLDRLLALYSGP